MGTSEGFSEAARRGGFVALNSIFIVVVMIEDGDLVGSVLFRAFSVLRFLALVLLR